MFTYDHKNTKQNYDRKTAVQHKYITAAPTNKLTTD
jgi:hypothetical protein